MNQNTKHTAAERVIELQCSLRFMNLSNSQNYYELIGMNVNNWKVKIILQIRVDFN